MGLCFFLEHFIFFLNFCFIILIGFWFQGTSDPYVVMDLDGQVAKSKTRWGQVSFNFHFCFPRCYGFFLYLA